MNLRQNEELLGVYRKTWLVLAGRLALSVFLAFIPFVFIFIVPPLLSRIFVGLPITLFILISVFWWWILWVMSFVSLINYLLDAFVVTNRRLIHIEQHGPFNRKVSELALERVQDISIDQKGVMPTSFHYGDIKVETAAESEEFIFIAIPRPNRVKDLIMNAYQKLALENRPLPSS